ncbi:protein-tyrosine phosphatase [Okibacterium sp. HSC-33S16]|uniref:tyrosine-protein phosphatase n=1 Tax=Okibacterium sp. HSC-33S16 TaxID=2910965 RepID=UPI00209DC3FA|nr:tyrosine-protein phosphatase [Okibacterium sp. HSC-33S16]MCP2030476.1 protein-tyrosine phosphatase [Okibacterium sp. HSC-33S16]
MTIAPKLPVSGTYNFRDVGGYPTLDGRVRYGRLLRSDGLYRLGEDGKQHLRELGVGTVIDLRDDFEVGVMPDDLDGLDVRTVHLPLFEGSGASQGEAAVSLAVLYRRIVTQHSEVVARALRELLVMDESPVLVHCTAGKDRTGIVVALALLAVGVDRELVVEDYARSEGNLSGEWLENMISIIVEHGGTETPELRTLMGGSPGEVLDAVLDELEAEHGSVRQYLLRSGLTLEELSMLQDALVEEV